MKTEYIKRIATGTKTFLIAGALLVSGHALAQGQAAQPQPPVQRPEAAPEMNEEKMDQVAEAYLEVVRIQNEVQAKVSGESDQEVAQRHVQEGQSKMIAAIRSEGLEVNEYESAMTKVTTDDSLRQQFVALLQEKRGDEG